IDWLPVSRISHSWSWVPSVIRKECEKTTEVAATRRNASKLFCLSIASPPGLPPPLDNDRAVAVNPASRLRPRLRGEQPGDPLAVPSGVAKGDFRGLGALEVEAQIVLPGEADASMQLDAGA